MIRAGTSAGGCCATCGAPFLRVTERTKLSRVRPNDITKRRGAAGTGNKCNNTVAGVASRTLGFRPGCACGVAQGVITPIPVPCRVLDPFGGVGTTAIAADALGRDCVVVDLYQEYLDEVKQRLLRRRAVPATVPAVRNSDESDSASYADPDRMTIEQIEVA